jgi:hypothetical protein
MKNQERSADKKRCVTCFVEKDYSLFSKNKPSADGYLSQCKECLKEKRRNLNITNPEAYELAKATARATKARLGKEHLKASKTNWDIKNAEHVKKYRDEHYKENAEYIKQHQRDLRLANPGIASKRTKAWKLRNPEKALDIKRYCNANYRAKKINASVSWKDNGKIDAIYKEAKRLSKLMWIEFHVDHIIPLQGEFVSGLHWEGNLQILTAFENLSKRNRLLTDDIC